MSECHPIRFYALRGLQCGSQSSQEHRQYDAHSCSQAHGKVAQASQPSSPFPPFLLFPAPIHPIPHAAECHRAAMPSVWPHRPGAGGGRSKCYCRAPYFRWLPRPGGQQCAGLQCLRNGGMQEARGYAATVPEMWTQFLCSPSL